MSFVAGWRSHPRELTELEVRARVDAGGYIVRLCLNCNEACTLLFVLALFVV